MNPSTFTATLSIEMVDLWQAGSGRGEGKHQDSVPILDAQGLPYLPGRTVKGLLRDAVWHLESIDALSALVGSDAANATVRLFGSRDGQEDGGNGADTLPPQTRFTSRAGSLWVSDARLSPAIRQALVGQTTLRAALFHETFATAIEARTGQAKSQSLRSKRVCVPMLLSASLETNQDSTLKMIEAALPLIDALGSQRTRGLGRCLWTLQRLPQATAARRTV